MVKSVSTPSDTSELSFYNNAAILAMEAALRRLTDERELQDLVLERVVE